ncbi:MAG: RsmD family RNA methyltransferase [Planctomycetaceae bacterium]|jgi:16S rRNA (guanine966-N2)-methyltransferase|nr:RsmD family RNA methyltransferase [Planctomycetaceae bacterium]
MKNKSRSKKQITGRDETVFKIDSNNRGQIDMTQFSAKPESKQAKRKNKKRKNIGSEPYKKEPVGLRIVGGKFRGSRLVYTGNNRVRPMKDRVREAVFNLIGPAIRGKRAIDLFGGTGALAIEAISRGAVAATVIEMHLPTAVLLRQNLEALNLLNVCQLCKTDAFFWAKNHEMQPNDDIAWIVFCSPPYSFYVEREDELLEMLRNLINAAPTASVFIIESDNRFDFNKLPIKPNPNKIRSYPPAEIAIFSKIENF